MIARILQIVLIASLVLVSQASFAGEADQDPQEGWRQMQEMGRQMFQNMQEKGIDPREFFSDVGKQVQDGTFDLSALHKKMIDAGVIDQASIDKMQSLTQNTTLDSIKQRLEVTDEEWLVLKPKIERVVRASSNAESNPQMRGMMGGMMGGGNAPKSDQVKEVDRSRRELAQTVADPKAAPSDYQIKVNALRDARRKAKEELMSAQKDLIEVLTVRQEGALVLMGLL